MSNPLRSKKNLLLLVLVLLLSLTVSASALAFGKGAKGPDVYAVQGMLKSLGYFSGSITGYYGKETEHGVKLFQKAYGLRVTGAVDDRTLESILWAYGHAKIKKNPAPAPEPAPEPKALEPAPHAPQPSSHEPSAEERQMVGLVNQVRAGAGLAPLAMDADLPKVARLKSQDMADKSYFSHESPTYGSPFNMMKQFGISYRTAGENIACSPSVDAAHQELMDSPVHRANILNKEFTHIGIGIVVEGQCGKIFTQQFISRPAK